MVIIKRQRWVLETFKTNQAGETLSKATPEKYKKHFW